LADTHPTVSAILDNTILLRRFELESRLQRLVSVIKMLRAPPTRRCATSTSPIRASPLRAVLASDRAAHRIGNHSRDDELPA
jgi:hypothetical protein